jgi:glycerol-3-phosphate acyltransferase PlsY
MLLYILWAIGAYVFGSIPFGLLVAHALGEIDPRTSGSKNIGSTNVLRVSGKKAGILTLVGDIGKGVVAAVIAQSLGAPRSWVLLISFAVVFRSFLHLRVEKVSQQLLAQFSALSHFLEPALWEYGLGL